MSGDDPPGAVVIAEGGLDFPEGIGREARRVSGLAEELSELLGVRVDVVAAPLLRDEVSATALVDAVAV